MPRRPLATETNDDSPGADARSCSCSSELALESARRGEDSCLETIIAAAAALLISASVTLAQPPGITPEMISRALPLEGAPLAVPGPYKVTSEGAFGSPGLHVYRPEALEAFPEEGLAARDGVGQRRLRD